MAAPGVDVDTVLLAQALGFLSVEDAEVEVELLAHLLLPLALERGRAYDHDAPGAMAADQLLRDKGGLDGLTKADVVGKQEADAVHLQRADDRDKLVGLDLDRAKEGRRQRWAGDDGVARPAQGVSVRHKSIDAVERVRPREVRGVVDFGGHLALPDHLKPVAESVIVEAFEPHFAADAAVCGVFIDIEHHVVPVTGLNELALFGDLLCGHGRSPV